MVKLTLVLPSSVEPTELEAASTLKILFAAKINGIADSIKFSTDSSLAPGGLFPTLVIEDRVLFNANAAVRYLFKLVPVTVIQDTLNWFEWEENQKFSDPASLEFLNKQLDGREILADPVDVLIFSSLYPLVSKNSKFLCNYQKLQAWYHKCLQMDFFVHCVEKLKSFYSAENSMRINSSVRFFTSKPQLSLPKAGERNVLITSALPYVNNVPHLGNIIGCVLSADVFARFCRLRGYNTLYICGTDEYGTATETKAIEEGVSCQQLCDKYNKLHAQIYDWFDIDFDMFGRTTTPVHTKIAQDIFMKLYNRGLLSTDSMMQLFCENCNRYLADRYVEGVCPLCAFPDARGDQCDGCGKLLNATELKEPRCKLDGNTPIVKESKHMFLDLPQLQAKCESFVEKASEEGFWSTNGRSITASWLKEGLKPRCITRDLKWGTPVPVQEMADKVLYVWFDAPIGYLSITANYTSEWEKWWKNPENVKLYQFMGKDNVPFHTVIFPCTLLGTEEPYTLLHHLSTTEYLNYEGDKFSKSRGIGVFGNNVMESGIDVAIWRYTLLSSRPETGDSMFTWGELGLKTNSELLANFGNFINRVLKYLKAKFNSVVPEAKFIDSDKVAVAELNSLLEQYLVSMEAVKIRHSIKIFMDISARANQYLQDNKLDNTLFESDRARCGTIIAVACNIIYVLSALCYPFMPSTSQQICKQLNVPQRCIPDKFEIDLLAGHRIGTPDHLFKRLDEKVLDKLFLKYGGEKILKKRAEESARLKAASKGKSVNTAALSTNSPAAKA